MARRVHDPEQSTFGRQSIDDTWLFGCHATFGSCGPEVAGRSRGLSDQANANIVLGMR
jgi:hypothetical protein